MPSHSVAPLWPWILQTKVHVPAWSTTVFTGAAGGMTSGSEPVICRVPSDSGASPGLIAHRSCGTLAEAGKFHRTVSPTFAVAAAGVQALGVAVMSTVDGVPPPVPASAGSVADSVTSTGPVYVPPAPGDAGDSALVVTGGVFSPGAAIEKSTDFTVSTLP